MTTCRKRSSKFLEELLELIRMSKQINHKSLPNIPYDWVTQQSSEMKLTNVAAPYKKKSNNNEC